MSGGLEAVSASARTGVREIARATGPVVCFETTPSRQMQAYAASRFVVARQTFLP
jgi:hypothetical protein